jgi:hypothetical protein
MKDKVAKVALLWTAGLTLLFWLIVQESARINLQEMTSKLEGQVKVLEMSHATICDIDQLKNRIAKLEVRIIGSEEYE